MLKYILSTVIGLAALLIVAACDYATPADREALRKVQEQWGDKYEFKLSSETYWTARAKPKTMVDEEEMRTALTVFTTRAGDQRSGFVYLNVYDSTGQFVFQLSRDPDGKIGKELKAEHY